MVVRGVRRRTVRVPYRGMVMPTVRARVLGVRRRVAGLVPAYRRRIFPVRRGALYRAPMGRPVRIAMRRARRVGIPVARAA